MANGLAKYGKPQWGHGVLTSPFQRYMPLDDAAADRPPAPKDQLERAEPAGSPLRPLRPRALPGGSAPGFYGFLTLNCLRSCLFQIAFLDDALMRLAHALDAVLQGAAALGQLSDDLVVSAGCRFIEKTAAQVYRLARLELVHHFCSDCWRGRGAARS